MNLLDEMLNLGWLREETGTRASFSMTTAGEVALTQLGVDVSNARLRRRPFAYGCLDWTERRQHLRGSLAAAVLAAMVTSRIINRQKGLRTVALDRPISEWLNTVSV